MKPVPQAPSATQHPPMTLTRAQRQVLTCLETEWRAGRTVDSVAHLCTLMGLKSRGALHRHVLALVRHGQLMPLDHQCLGLRRPAADARLGSMPTLRAMRRLGRIAAGAPLDAVFDDDPVLVPEHLIPAKDAYILEVRGDSMSGDGILDGDLVIVEVDPAVRAGELAIVLVAGEGATLKRFRQEGQQIRLIASNPMFPDQLVAAHDVMVQGRVSGLMRKYST